MEPHTLCWRAHFQAILSKLLSTSSPGVTSFTVKSMPFMCPSPRFIHLQWIMQMNGNERPDRAEGHSLNRPRPILAQYSVNHQTWFCVGLYWMNRWTGLHKWEEPVKCTETGGTRELLNFWFAAVTFTFGINKLLFHSPVKTHKQKWCFWCFYRLWLERQRVERDFNDSLVWNKVTCVQ